MNEWMNEWMNKLVTDCYMSLPVGPSSDFQRDQLLAIWHRSESRRVYKMAK